jgi:hypothetical protein
MIFAPLDTENISTLRNVKNDFVRAKIIDSSDNPALIRDTARRYVDQEPPSLIKNTIFIENYKIHHRQATSVF